jgi:regulator of replication initiation timing
MNQLSKLEMALEDLQSDFEKVLGENQGLEAEVKALRAKVAGYEAKYGMNLVEQPAFSSREVEGMTDGEYAEQRENIRRSRQEGRFLHNNEGALGRWKRRLGIRD